MSVERTVPSSQRGRRAVGVLALLLVAVAVGVAGPPGRSATGLDAGGDAVGDDADRPPNIVVVTTDDQDLASVEHMPKLRKVLAEEGVTFERHTVSFSLCCPSRATFLTGQHGHNNGVRDNFPPAGGYVKLNPAETLPVWLQRAGYATGHIGKYPNGYGYDSHQETNGVPPGWDDWRGTPEERAYYYYGYLINENGTLVAYGERPEDYQNDVVTRLGQRFIQTRAKGPKPFFLSVNYLAPHWELYPGSAQNLTAPLGLLNPIEGQPFSESETFAPPVPAPRHKGMFAGVPAPRPPSYDEAEVSDKPASVQRRPPLSQEQHDRIDLWYQLRLESLQSVDEGIAQLVATLKANRELDDTVFVFTSDNGWMQGEHRIPDGKVVVYEPSTRIPLVVRGPGVRPGGRVADWTTNVDVPATILDIARATPGLPQDGTSLVPYLSDPGRTTGRVVLHETQPAPDVRAYTGLRAGRWKYVEYPDPNKPDVARELELYDLVADSHELTSLHADPALALLRQRLAAILGGLRNCKGHGCVVTGFQE